ncbi:response regulator [Methylobacterium sp. J-068]|uniref:response regulator n=1 Tax=Methylobacterium sp. J-068 TaxID=2836649 RepID=UPI001FB9289E|nr:response regulator [Methylobacterium sp. J-068]MCJ2032642.1 response regulator [Methylobacterium sp. J-068]
MTEPLDIPCALVADDDFLIRMDAETILEDAGFCAFTAKDANEALDILAQEESRIVLLFTDVDMPGGPDGFELARTTSRRWPDISIVVASGRAKPGPDDLPEGAVFLDKPFSTQIVHDHIDRILPDGQKPEPLKRRNR